MALLLSDRKKISQKQCEKSDVIETTKRGGGVQALFIRKIFILALILFFSAIHLKTVWAESRKGPQIKYTATVAGFETKKIGSPTCIYIDAYNDMYILGDGAKTLYIFSDLYQPSATLSQGQGLISPLFFAVSEEGEVYAVQNSAEKKSSFISVFNFNRKKIKTIQFEGFKGAKTFVPNAIALDKEKKIYLAGYTQPGVVVLDKKGVFFRMLTPIDALRGKEPKPVVIRDLALDKEDNIYLLSETLGRVYVYNQKFEFLFKFGRKGGVPRTLSRPRGIAVDQKGRIYITDYMRHCLNVYDSDGSYLAEFGGKGTDHGWFNYPQDVAVTKNDMLAVADLFNKRVELFRIID